MWKRTLCAIASACLVIPVAVAATGAIKVYGHFMIQAADAVSMDMAAACAALERAGVFLCHYHWASGAGGKRGVALVADAALLDAARDATGVAFVHARDDYMANPTGAYLGRLHDGDASPAPRKLMLADEPRAPKVLLYLNARFDDGVYRANASGKGVTVYVVDQRIAVGLSELPNLAPRSFSSLSANATRDAPCAAEHGTHVAALIGGARFGVAKDVEIVSVAVSAGCGLDGRASELMEGLDWVLDDMRANARRKVVAIATLVKDSGVADMVEAQIERLIEGGAVVVSAAGDAADDACAYVPARTRGVVTVAGAEMIDRTAGVPTETSNYGRCVSVTAPGSAIESASSSQNATAMFTGTAQAMALVSGIAAQILETGVSPGETRAQIRRQSSNAVMRWTTPGTPEAFAQVDLPACCDCGSCPAA